MSWPLQPGRDPVQWRLPEALCAIYPVAAAARAAEALDSNNLPLPTFAEILLRQNRERIYPLSESETPHYQNLNRPSDLP